MLKDKLKRLVDTTEREDESFISTLAKYAPIYDDFENATLVTAEEYQAQNPTRTYRFSEIGDQEIKGFPICVKRHEDGELHATFTDDMHALVVGATRSGKTTGFVLPFLHLMSKKKNKPCMVLSDPKGELYRDTHRSFEESGYKVIVLNFLNYQQSDCWNPLTKIYRMYQKYLNIESLVDTEVEGDEVFYVFENEKYRSEGTLKKAVAAAKDSLYTEVDNAIISIAETISPVENEKDPFWEQSACVLIQGFLWAMLEDSDPKGLRKGRPLIDEHTFSFRTMNAIFSTFDNSPNGLDDKGFFNDRSVSTSKALRLVGSSIINLSANVTRGCIISSFLAKMKLFKDACTERLTCTNTFDIRTLANDERPTVIYVQYKDEDSLHYKIITMFLSDLYIDLIDTARHAGGKLERPFYFLLDEFGNFPRFNSFENVISACGGRNIWFLLVVQSYAQLYRVYNKETAEIIIDNLNMHLFFGSNNHMTKKAFSEECGEHTVLSPITVLNGSNGEIDNFHFSQAPLVPISRLNHLNIGEFYVTQMRGDVIHSFTERSYLCPEFKAMVDATPRKSVVDFANKKYELDLTHYYNK